MSSVERTTRINFGTYSERVAELTIEEVATIIEGQAVALAPVADGGLKGSIARKRIGVGSHEVEANVDYAVYVEFGTGDQGSGSGRKWTYWSDKLQRFVSTSGMAAQPFMRPALDFVRNRIWRVWKKYSQLEGQ